MTTTGKLIKSTREKREYTQMELAYRVGKISHVFISDIESGKKSLPIRRASDFARALRLDRERLINAIKQDFSEKIEARK